jgi:hypothetical protein
MFNNGFRACQVLLNGRQWVHEESWDQCEQNENEEISTSIQNTIFVLIGKKQRIQTMVQVKGQ